MQIGSVQATGLTGKISEDTRQDLVGHQRCHVSENGHIDELRRHFQLLVSRRTTASVEVHCIAKAKKTTRAMAPPRVKSCRSAACSLVVGSLDLAVECPQRADDHFARHD